MAKKMYAVVGNWGFAPAPKGISVYEYLPDNGELHFLNTIRQDVAAGQLVVDNQKNIVYAVNECGDCRGEYGGGGYLLAFRMNAQTGELTLINEKKTLCPEPSYICLDKSGKYLLVCHCADPWHVTKIVRREDGTLANEILFDDAALVLFRIHEDGSLGEICDAMNVPGNNRVKADSQVNVDPVTNHIQLIQVISRLHSIVASPDSELFIACDKGMDKLYTFKIDREAGRIMKMYEHDAKWSSFPRYGAFHPQLPIFYANNEYNEMLNVFHYDSGSGVINCLCEVPVLFENPGLICGKPVGAQDIQIHPNGKSIYISLSGTNGISVLTTDSEGLPTLVQNIDSGGNLPRGLCISPDGRFLISGNMVSGDITTFRIQTDGTLEATGKKIPAVSPSVIRMFVCEN